MASDFITLQGKCTWNYLTMPDAQFGEPKYKIKLYPDAASYEKILKLKEPPAIMNVIGKDDDGYFINISRPVTINNRGKMQALPLPQILDGKNPLPNGGFAPLDARVGHGSDVTVKCEVRSYNTKAKTAGRSLRLTAVRVDNLVPFNTDNFTDTEKKTIEGLAETPEQVW